MGAMRLGAEALVREPEESKISKLEKSVRRAMEKSVRRVEGAEGEKFVSKEKWCSVCQVRGHSKRTCEVAGGERCWICGERGHEARDCPSRACHDCGSTYHISKECPYRSCHECGERGHLTNVCPRKLCYVCHERGHIGEDCEVLARREGARRWTNEPRRRDTNEKKERREKREQGERPARREGVLLPHDDQPRRARGRGMTVTGFPDAPLWQPRAPLGDPEARGGYGRGRRDYSRSGRSLKKARGSVAGSGMAGAEPSAAELSRTPSAGNEGAWATAAPPRTCAVAKLSTRDRISWTGEAIRVGRVALDKQKRRRESQQQVVARRSERRTKRSSRVLLGEHTRLLDECGEKWCGRRRLDSFSIAVHEGGSRRLQL